MKILKPGEGSDYGDDDDDDDDDHDELGEADPPC